MYASKLNALSEKLNIKINKNFEEMLNLYELLNQFFLMT